MTFVHGAMVVQAVQMVGEFLFEGKRQAAGRWVVLPEFGIAKVLTTDQLCARYPGARQRLRGQQPS